MSSAPETSFTLSKRVFSKILDSLDQGVIVVGRDQNLIFLNKYLKKFLNIFNYENLKLQDVLKISASNININLNLICPPFEIQKDGIVFNEDNVFLETFDGHSKVVKLTSYKFLEFTEEEIHCLIVISDNSGQIELEKMKTDFSALSVHSLRTPISIIRNNLDFMKREEFLSKLSFDEKKFVEGLVSGADQLRDLVENMISLTEIQTERIKLNLVSTSIVYLIKQVVEEQKLSAAKKGVGVVFLEPLYNIPNIYVDSIKIYDVITTVVNNAIKFSEKGEVVITLTKDIGYLVIKVSDKGLGISEVGLKNIFNKFYHYKSSPLVMSEGLGISLYMSKKIMEAHLGSIEIDSIEGVGTNVTLKIPTS
jgi:signal transduction histidine kinase